MLNGNGNGTSYQLRRLCVRHGGSPKIKQREILVLEDKEMKDSNDLAVESANATTISRHAAFSQKSSKRKCQMFCKSTQGEEPMNIDFKLTSEPIEGKSPEEYYAQGICELTGAENKELAEHIVWQGILSMSMKDRAAASNIVFQTLAEQQPKDPYEARLSTQAMALYTQGMKYLASFL